LAYWARPNQGHRRLVRGPLRPHLARSAHGAGM
jgi:hypothetical protein